MPNEERQGHVHFMCPSCERVFCTDDLRYGEMADGDTCPTCHVVNVERIPDPVPEDVLPQGMQRNFASMTETLHMDVNARYLLGLLAVAMHLFPYMTQDMTMKTPPLAAGATITPNEGRRATAAVELAFLMEDMIAKRLAARAQENLDRVRDIAFPGEQPPEQAADQS